MINIKRWQYMSPFKRRKMKQQRITQGFCDYDAWGMNEFLATIIPAMLNKLADDGQSYAGNSKEEWKSRLSAIAMEFEQLRELLICDNIPLKTLQNWMGHNDTQMILDIYSKLTKEQEVNDATKLTNFIMYNS